MSKKFVPTHEIAGSEWLRTNGVYEVERIEGRKGSSDEYVEFSIRTGRDRRSWPVVSYIVQGGYEYAWFVYRVEPGKDGAVRAIAQFHKSKRDEAIESALEAVNNHFGPDSPIM